MLALGGYADARLGMSVQVLGDELGFVISAPPTDEVVLVLTDNPFGANEAVLAATLPPLIAPLIPGLADAFGAIPLPTLFDFDVSPIAVLKMGPERGAHFGIFIELVAAQP
jgi:hypothetical protein